LLAGSQSLTRHCFERFEFGVVVRRLDVLDLPRPRREEYTICAARAPEAVFTVRTYGDTATRVET
jgi:hypothetical protein